MSIILHKCYKINIKKNLLVDPQSTVVHLPQGCRLFVQVLHKENINIFVIITFLITTTLTGIFFMVWFVIVSDSAYPINEAQQ